MSSPTSRRLHAGFTLVELLVVIGIIALLISILLPSLNKAREAARIIKCGANIRSMVQASMLRAQDNPRCPAFLPTNGASGDSLGYWFPRYLRDTSIAICPSTNNYIRPKIWVYISSGQNASAWYYDSDKVPEDIVITATSRESYGASYEPYGWYSHGVFPDGRTIDGRKVGTFQSQLGISNPKDPRSVTTVFSPLTTDVVKKVGKLYGQSNKTILLADKDGDTSTATTQNNWPDANNNHGVTGTNFGFADGHVEFVRRGPEIIRTFLDGYNDPAMSKAFVESKYPGLTYNSTYKLPGDTSNISFPKYTLTN